jgi:hypothetical protein
MLGVVFILVMGFDVFVFVFDIVVGGESLLGPRRRGEVSCPAS